MFTLSLADGHNGAAGIINIVVKDIFRAWYPSRPVHTLFLPVSLLALSSNSWWFLSDFSWYRYCPLCIVHTWSCLDYVTILDPVVRKLAKVAGISQPCPDLHWTSIDLGTVWQSVLNNGFRAISWWCNRGNGSGHLCWFSYPWCLTSSPKAETPDSWQTNTKSLNSIEKIERAYQCSWDVHNLGIWRFRWRCQVQLDLGTWNIDRWNAKDNPAVLAFQK